LKSRSITTWILIAMVLGIGTGYLCNRLAPDAGTAKEIAGYL
jgi:Na+/H+-dicarboxylate symporter